MQLIRHSAEADARLSLLGRCSLEIGLLLIIAVSAAVGLALRALVSVVLGRAFLWLGLVGLVAGLGILTLSASGYSPFGPWTGRLLAAVLLGLAAFVLPFALVVSWGRL